MDYVNLSAKGRLRLSRLLKVTLVYLHMTWEEAIANYNLDRAMVSQILMNEDYDWCHNLLSSLLPVLIKASWQNNNPVLPPSKECYKTLTELIEDLESHEEQDNLCVLNAEQLDRLRRLFKVIQQQENLRETQMPERLGISPCAYRDIIGEVDCQIEWTEEKLATLTSLLSTTGEKGISEANGFRSNLYLETEHHTETDPDRDS